LVCVKNRSGYLRSASADTDSSIGGNPLATWADYFPEGKIVGIDIAEKKLELGPRITLRRGSQDDPAFLQRISGEFGPFDIVIDDGSHVPAHVTKSFSTLFPLIADGGLYVIEDVQTSFWPQWGGPLADGGATVLLALSMLHHLNYTVLARLSQGASLCR
jgi:cephalosporin hydroxylase